MMRPYDDPETGGVYAPPREEPAGSGWRLEDRRAGRDYPAGRRSGTQPGWRGNGGRRPPARRPPAGRAGPVSHRVLGIAAVVVTAILVIASLSAYVAYRNVYDSIKRDNVTSAMLGKRPPKLNGAVNVLVIGSDSRKGTHGRYGRGIYGSRSDTSILLHISPDHRRAVAISFPRDSIVPVYGCLADGNGHPGQQAAPGQTEMLNASYSAGGPACLWKTLEQTTHIRIDHFVEVNFAGFKSIVNDVGGVKVCLPFAINDPASGLHLTAGVHNVTGAQALAFVRERHIGLGSDLQRIQRQQYFLASAMQKIKQMNLLGSPDRVYRLIDDVAKSLTVDSGLTPTVMAGIASSVSGLSSGALHFISVPVIPDPADPSARVLWQQPQADHLFSAIAHDTRLPKTRKKSNGHGSSPAPAPTVNPAQVKVTVLDGSGTAGVATTTATALTSRGFDVIGTGNAPSFTYTATLIEYGSASDLPAARTLAAQVGQAQVRQSASVTPGTVSLILGSDFTGLHQASSSGSSLSKLSKAYGGISGSTNICKDSAAFAGPDTPAMFGG
jgi:LCP family protein required for cell wall assembly